MPNNPSRVFAVLPVMLTVLFAPSTSVAQDSEDWTYQVGGRTTVMAATMHLSHLGGVRRPSCRR